LQSAQWHQHNLAVILQPSSLKDLARGLSHACALGEPVERVDLTALNHVVGHAPADMTVTVEAGLALAALQRELAGRGQWLPVDPPAPERLTIRELLEENSSGPRRFGYGTVRDYLIGLKVVLPDGRIISSGGKVVKNVAGYDLAKLFIGSRGTLGIVAEATFKLRPRPDAEKFVQARIGSLEKGRALIESVLDSELVPVVLDLHNLSASVAPPSGGFTVVLGFAGTAEDVDWQIARSAELGISDPSNLAYEKTFWDGSPAQRLAVLPSRLVDELTRLDRAPFVARAGNGVIYHRAGLKASRTELPVKLIRRLKDAFDPKRTLPELPA
jgi:glycolate oxidase FAD binding subunit